MVLSVDCPSAGIRWKKEQMMEDTCEFPGSVYNLRVLAWSRQAGVKRRAVELSQRGAGWLWGLDCSSEGRKATFGFSTVI